MGNLSIYADKGDVTYLREVYDTPEISTTAFDPSSIICQSGNGTSEGFGFEDWSN